MDKCTICLPRRTYSLPRDIYSCESCLCNSSATIYILSNQTVVSSFFSSPRDMLSEDAFTSSLHLNCIFCLLGHSSYYVCEDRLFSLRYFTIYALPCQAFFSCLQDVVSLTMTHFTMRVLPPPLSSNNIHFVYCDCKMYILFTSSALDVYIFFVYSDICTILSAKAY